MNDKTKFRTYFFRVGMASPKSCRFLYFQINICLVAVAIPIHILTNISRSKGNQKMKFDQVLEYKMKNIFLQKSC